MILFKFDRDVPIPTPRGRQNTGMKAWLAAMAVGDSALLGDANPKGTRSVAWTLKPKEFTVRLNESGAYRVWRLV